MNWNQARAQYPDRWLLIEAASAHSEQNRRLLEDLTIVSVFEESKTALQRYLDLHRTDPNRELYVAHTSREFLDIEERRWVGVRMMSASLNR
jgi:hypothetical protein